MKRVMKREIPVFLSIALTTLAIVPATPAFSSPAHARPPGIAASAWIPISNDLAAVVERLKPDPMAAPGPGTNHAPEQPVPTLGYFVFWRGNHWLRLDSLVQQTMSRRSSPRPSKWMSIDENLAFVIERQLSGQLMRDQPSTPSVLGYFTVKHNGHWLRLQPIAQGALYRGPLRSSPRPNWIPIGKSLRFVIEQQMPQRYTRGQFPSVLGYFMGKDAGHWIRLGSIA